MAKANLQTATNGSVRVPFDQRDGATSDVFFTRDLSPEGLRRAVAKVAPRLSGKIAIKLHTGEKDGPNIIPFGWVKDLVSKDLLRRRPLHHRTASRDHCPQRLDVLPCRHYGRGRRCHSTRCRRQMV